MPEERIHKILSAAGVASRRASEALITSGRVRVDGRVASIGDRADPQRSQIEVDGMLVGIGAARSYVALHKPSGVTATTRDRHADVTVIDLVPTTLTPDGTRLYPVGRLDRDSEGLLLLTNDGTWADHVLHPRFGVQREYAIALARPLDHDQAALLRAGIALEEGPATFAAPLRPATAIETKTLSELLHPAPDPELVWYRGVLVQGWKRQLRRMFAAVGAPIERLVRVRIGTVRLDRLPTGRARLLRAPEVRQLGTVPPGLRAGARPGSVAVNLAAIRRGASPAPSGPLGAVATGEKSGPRGGAPKRQKGLPGSSGPRKPAPKPAPQVDGKRMDRGAPGDTGAAGRSASPRGRISMNAHGAPRSGHQGSDNPGPTRPGRTRQGPGMSGPTGPRPAGPRPAGPRPAGPRPAGPRPPAPGADTPRPARSRRVGPRVPD